MKKQIKRVKDVALYQDVEGGFWLFDIFCELSSCVYFTLNEMGYETLTFYDWFVFTPFQRLIKNKLFWYTCFWKNLKSVLNNLNTTSIKYMPIIWKSNNHMLIPPQKSFKP
jgi:hypothetical protein